MARTAQGTKNKKKRDCRSRREGKNRKLERIEEKEEHLTSWEFGR